MKDLLARLSEAFGPPGAEDEVRAILQEELKDRWDEAYVDSMGNLIASFGRSRKGPRAMIAAHMDEVGFIVDFIEEDGSLRFKKVGGIDDRVLPASRVRVGRHKVPGVIGLKPKHLLKGDEAEKVVESDDLFIDIGARSRSEAEEVVRPGDYAAWDTPFRTLSATVVSGKALDDRAGCAMAAALAKEELPLPVDVAFTVQEEIGLRGAKVAAERVRPDFAVVLEATTCADMPDPSSRRRSTLLGRGPALTFQDASSIPHRGLLELLVRTAEDEGIPYQWKQTTAGGNDAGSIHVAAGGIPTVSISLPCRYLHTPRSLLSLADMEQAVRLVRAFLERIARKGLPGAGR